MLGSQQAIQMGVLVVRSFVRTRQMVVSHRELGLRLDELESQAALVSMRQGAFEEKATAQFRQIFDALRQLMAPPDGGAKQPIGFVRLEEKATKPKSRAASR